MKHRVVGSLAPDSVLAKTVDVLTSSPSHNFDNSAGQHLFTWPFKACNFSNPRPQPGQLNTFRSCFTAAFHSSSALPGFVGSGRSGQHGAICLSDTGFKASSASNCCLHASRCLRKDPSRHRRPQMGQSAAASSTFLDSSGTFMMFFSPWQRRACLSRVSRSAKVRPQNSHPKCEDVPKTCVAALFQVSSNSLAAASAARDACSSSTSRNSSSGFLPRLR
mmetsp:Transcript_4434/g.12591  ORF Transcript_4434/g.12591 Transcript_4434/m.12591 type:complete len:220 (+) Transcript_4434:3532-4191(+)